MGKTPTFVTSESRGKKGLWVMKTIRIYGGVTVAIFAGAILWTFKDDLHTIGVIVGGAVGAFVVVGLLRFGGPVWKGIGGVVIGMLKHKMDVKDQEQRLFLETATLSMEYDLRKWAMVTGRDIEVHPNRTMVIHAPRPYARERELSQSEERKIIDAPMPIPDMVRYEDIRVHIPKDHVLIGVGEGGVVDTREKEIKGLIWLPGSSGAGKSNTTGLRVEEDYERGHRFLGIDPHFFKADSLSNLVKGYMDRFIAPIAYKPEDILRT